MGLDRFWSKQEGVETQEAVEDGEVQGKPAERTATTAGDEAAVEEESATEVEEESSAQDSSAPDSVSDEVEARVL